MTNGLSHRTHFHHRLKPEDRLVLGRRDGRLFGFNCEAKIFQRETELIVIDIVQNLCALVVRQSWQVCQQRSADSIFAQ